MNTIQILPKNKPHYLIVNRMYSLKSIMDIFQNLKLPSIKPNKETKTPITKSTTGKENGYIFWKVAKVSVAVFGISGIYFVFTLIPYEELDLKPLNNLYNNYLISKRNAKRIYQEFSYYLRLIKQPNAEKLLPDPLEFPYNQPKYTLVLELTDVLVHPEWHPGSGWRFKKRPLLGMFLESVHESYEVVLYTSEYGMRVFPLLDVLDPSNFIAYKLVRNATYFHKGHHVKNLRNLNRDLSKVIYIDWNERNVVGDSENLFRIKRWEGCENDRSLLDLAELLKVISENDIEDVRVVIKYYKKYEDPLKEFREKQQKLIEELDTQAAAKRNKPKKKSKLRRLFNL